MSGSAEWSAMLIAEVSVLACLAPIWPTTPMVVCWMAPSRWCAAAGRARAPKLASAAPAPPSGCPPCPPAAPAPPSSSRSSAAADDRPAGAASSGKAAFRKLWPVTSPQVSTAADIAAARDLLGRYPLVDGHNDLPWTLRVADELDPDTTDLAAPVASTHTARPPLALAGLVTPF